MVLRAETPDRLEELFGADPEVHLYGLADLEEPYWSLSSWFVEGDAAVGVVGFPGSRFVTAYAMSERAPGPTLDLLVDVARGLPDGTLITGPLGLAERVRPLRFVNPLGRHWRMILEGPVRGAEDETVALTIADVDAVVALHETDPGGAFFMPHMLETGHFVGIWDGDRLLASAGTHVVSERFGVAAIGAVITDPQWRGKGLGSTVTRALLGVLVPRYSVVGLNVAERNTPAMSLYERLGFVRRFVYEEIEVL